MSLTYDDFPFPIYPGFKDPEDFGESEGDHAPDDRRAIVVRELVAAASDQHHGKHQRHQHPWCRGCYDRFNEAECKALGFDPDPDARGAWAKHWERTSEAMTEDAQKRLRSMFLDDVWKPQAGDGVHFGVSDEALQSWCELLLDLDNAEFNAQDRERILTRRVNRYLILHNGRVPKDDFEPEDEVTFDDEYLDRDDLDELGGVEYLVDSTLPANAYGIIRGRDGTGKTFVALDWCLSFATGKPWQGRTTGLPTDEGQRAPGRVLYIAGEGAHGISARVHAWEQTWNHGRRVENFLTRKSALNLHQPGEAFTDLLQRIQDQNIDLVVIDTLRRVSGAADGNGSEMGTVVDNIDQIKRATGGGSVLVITHTDKADNDSRGYSGIEDDADFVWHVKRQENAMTVENTKMKDGPDGTIHHLQARTAHGSLILSAASPGDELGESSRKLLDTLRYTFRDGAYSGQLMEASDLTKPTFYRALGALKDAGHVVNLGSHQRPFYVLAGTAQSHGSHEVSGNDTASDLQSLNGSHEVSSPAAGVSVVSPPLRGETETRDDTPGTEQGPLWPAHVPPSDGTEEGR